MKILKNKIEVSEEKKLSTLMFIDTLSKSFITYSKTNIIYKHPSVFVQGQPGIGKSQAIEQIAKNIESQTGKRTHITDIRLLLFNPIDLRGIPVPNIKDKVAVWLKPEIFNLNEDENVINILFLDELTAAPSSLQAAAYQIALNRRLGEHTIPNNTFIVAAGNRLEDNAISYEMPTALRNRFIHFELKADLNSWLNWAKEKGINEEIITFLKNNPDKFVTEDFDTSTNIIITPRSWEILSDLILTLGGSLRSNEVFVASVIGNSLTYLMLNSNHTISLADLLNGRVIEKPDNMGELQRVVDVLANQVSEYINNETYTKNILKYMCKIPMDYAIRIFRKVIKIKVSEYDITKLKEYQLFLDKISEYKEDE